MTSSSKENFQNRGLCLAPIVILIVLSLLLSILFVQGSFKMNAPSDTVALQDKINPNIATAGSLTRLPGIGRAKADAIISYRNNNLQSSPKPFKQPSDLDKIPGIGPKIIGDISGHLSFD
jgi:competence protein ComEA